MSFKLCSFACAIALLTGCVESTGGAGQTSGGQPVAGTLSLDYATGMYDVGIISPSGWVCNAQFKQSGQNLRVRTVPLTCNDGRRGNLVLTSNQFQGQAVGSFTLSNGESGQVVFGLT